MVISLKIAIENGTLISGNGEAPQPNTTVLIEDSIITQIGDRVSIPTDAQVINATGKTIMPGLIDVHLHLMGVRSMQPVQWVLDPPLLRATRAVADAQKLIEAGFTSVRCAGSDISVHLKKAIEEGTIPGPRIVASNKILTQTGGHGDIHQLPLEWVKNSEHHSRVVDGIDDCRIAAREQIRAGAGVIKIMTSGGVSSAVGNPMQPQFVDEEIAVITQEAHRVGIKVMSHAQNPLGIQSAIRNGVDTIEHGIFLDDDTIQMMLQHNTILVPTFAIGNAMRTRGKEMGVPEWALRKGSEVRKTRQDSIKQAYQAGVKIAMGSDFQGPDLVPHGENAVELELLVKEIGMTSMEAIVAATKTGAEVLGLEMELGTIELGKKADILLIDGDPLADITILQDKEKIVMVMKEGQIEVDRR